MKLETLLKDSKIISLNALSSEPELAHQIQDRLIYQRLLDPPTDGTFGKFTQQSLGIFQRLLNIQNDGNLNTKTIVSLLEPKQVVIPRTDSTLAGRVVDYMLKNKLFVSVGLARFNIVYVEGINSDGKRNNDLLNDWNDLRCIIEVDYNGRVKMLGSWLATTEPGDRYTYNPINPMGAARIAFGQYKSWKVGTHVGGGSEPHQALVQVKAIPVYRDKNKDGKRTGDIVDSGIFGINQHHGFDMAKVGLASAGCLVGKTRVGHKEFMTLIKADTRYQLDPNYTFMTTIIAGDKM